MSLRPPAISRCGFKLPKNDKYQCQKAGDKYQPLVQRWYCKLHDLHAQSRCQVLVKWAGKGGQCEHLGTLNQSSGKVLCEWHMMQYERDAPDVEQRSDSVQEVFGFEGGNDTLIADDPDPDDSTAQPLSLAIATEDAATEALHSAQPAIKSYTSSSSAEGCADSTLPQQVLSDEEHSSDARAFLDDTELDPDVPNREDSETDMIEEFGALHLVPALNDDAVKESTAPVAALFDSTQAAYSTTPSHQSVRAHINLLNALQDQDSSTSNRNAPVYTQCCVCLEVHGGYDMREVEPCKHQYRKICLRKATKIGSLRRFNCSSCRVWMAQEQDNVVKNGEP